MAKENRVRVLGADFSVGQLQNEDNEMQTCLLVGFQVAFFISDDNATDFYNSLGDLLTSNVIQLPTAADVKKALPRMDIPKGA